MKALLCYFSGTGNTKKVVSEFANNFDDQIHSIDLVKIEEGTIPNLEDYDALGIAYPIHAFNAPSIVVDFVKALPKQQSSKKLFIIKTSGEPLALNNISSIKITKLLKKRNFNLTNEYHLVMPYNMIFRHTDTMAYKMWQTATKILPIIYHEITTNKPAKLKHIFLGSFLAWIFRIEFWGGRFNGKKYKVNANCIHCGKCAKMCPVGNIKIDESGNFHFGNKCIMCMRCSMLCPTNAIKIGWFEGWKVHGAYTFKKPEKPEEERHKKYCKKSYEKYFAKWQQKILEFDEETKSKNKSNKTI